jgi:hypothetical protein
MSRLIDADALIELIESKTDLEFDEVTEKALVQMISEQDTAYDIEKVVAELEEEKGRNLSEWQDATNLFALTKYGHCFSAYANAIYIVKNGGVVKRRGTFL